VSRFGFRHVLVYQPENLCAAGQIVYVESTHVVKLTRDKAEYP